MVLWCNSLPLNVSADKPGIIKTNPLLWKPCGPDSHVFYVDAMLLCSMVNLKGVNNLSVRIGKYFFLVGTWRTQVFNFITTSQKASVSSFRVLELRVQKKKLSIFICSSRTITKYFLRVISEKKWLLVTFHCVDYPTEAGWKWWSK